MDEIIDPPNIEQQHAGLLSNVTPEHLAYLGIALVAAVLRFADLGVTPLNPGEATEALAVWNLWQSGDANVLPGSPAYLALTAPLTQVLGFTDHIMRLVPAVFGFFLVLTPWFIRHRSGRLGALLTAMLLALSPTQAIISRTGGGDTVGLFAGMFVFIAWLRYQESGDRRWLYTLAAALALGLASAPLFYGILAALLVAWVAQSAIGPALIQDSDGERAKLVKPSMHELRQALLIGVVGFLALATALLFAMRGLGSAADLAVAWLQDFQLWATATLRATPLLILARYEVGLLLLGLPAAAWAALREKPYPIFVVYWAIGAFLLILIQPVSNANVLLLTLPGYLLVGRFSNDLLKRSSSRWWWAFAIAVVFAGGVVYLNIVRYARLNGIQGVPNATYHILIAFIALMAVLILATLAWTWDRSAVVKGVLAGLLVLLAIFSWGSAWWFSRQAANDTRERWTAAATDNDIRLMLDTLEELSWRVNNSPDGVAVEAAIDTPALRWYLKEFGNATFANSISAGAAGPILITPLMYDPRVAENYLGAEYGYARPDTLHSLEWIDALRWWLFHQSPISVNEERLVLWLRADLAEAGQ
ncbi:MAG TPA: glycosyltransferase family 39 protein [Anaerolineae bacterium]|jgi:hypothetical protein|nr:glycosyltransferase family 39 protein [Anaerolineae bacterium]